jgi:hypothetical protein
MNQQEIIRQLNNLCSDIIIQDDTIYLDRLLTVGITVSDNSVTVFWETPAGKPRKETYTNITSITDIVDVWSEFMHHWNRTANRLRKALIQGTV